MNIQETTAILRILKLTYPQFYKGMSLSDATETIELWTMMFENDNAKIVTEAVKSMIVTLKYPPTIADIKEKISIIMDPDTMSELEAWGKVRSAISYYNAKDNFDKLEPFLQKLVGSANQLREWGMMDAEIINSVIQSNFMRSYKFKLKQDKEYKALPSSTKNLISELSEKMKMLENKNNYLQK